MIVFVTATRVIWYPPLFPNKTQYFMNIICFQSYTSHTCCSATLFMKYSIMLQYYVSHRLCTVFCFAVFCLGYMNSLMLYWSIFFRVTSRPLGQSYDCPSASETTLKDMGCIDGYQTVTTCKQCAYFMGCTWHVYHVLWSIERCTCVFTVPQACWLDVWSKLSSQPSASWYYCRRTA